MSSVIPLIVLVHYSQPSKADNPKQPGGAQESAGVGVISFLTALGSASAFFVFQLSIFLLLRNNLDRIFKPKTYLPPRDEQTLPPPRAFWRLIRQLCITDDQELIQKCGLDSYFFLRYLKTLLVIFIPIACIAVSALVPLNYIGGRGHKLNADKGKHGADGSGQVTGLDAFAWGNIENYNTDRYWAHLVVSVLCVLWTLFVFSMEMRVYITIRQDYLTTEAHRSKVSASTILVRSIPKNWLCEISLRNLFSVFPGGVKQVWLNRDLASVIRKITLRDVVHRKLEIAETGLILATNKAAARQECQREQVAEPASYEASRPLGDDPLNFIALGDRDNGTDPLKRLHSPRTDRLRWPHANHVSRVSQAACPPINGSQLAGVRSPGVSRGVLETMTKAGLQVRKRAMTTNGFVPLATLTETTEDAEELWKDERCDISGPHASSCITITQPYRYDRGYGPGAGSWWRIWSLPLVDLTPPTIEDRQERKRDSPDVLFNFWDSIFPKLRRTKQLDQRICDRKLFNYDQATNWQRGLWSTFLASNKRPTFRLPLLGITWLPGLPLVCKSVDTIEWCRKELCRLNVEINNDKKQQEKFPLLNSAFIQFNTQIAAHMACQNELYCQPGYMTTAVVETSPKDIIWENIGIGHRESRARSFIIAAILTLMISLWSIPVAWSGALSQVDTIVDSYHWLAFIRQTPALFRLIQVVAGLLPAAMLATLLFLLPLFLGYLAILKGVQTHSQKTQFVQKYYFVFLFIQVFLVVSIASFFTTSVSQLASNVKTLQKATDVMDLLAQNLPKAGNYFYSYMLLQGLSTSSATLLQTGALIAWYILSPLLDLTPREKWSRNTRLSSTDLGALFPVYTNFACIGFVYCTISPFISIFVILTFGLFWVAQKYTILYVNKFDYDTGGKLYPKAINQTFTGIYTMELCVSGLFFLVRDENDRQACIAHGTIMLLLLLATVYTQITLNRDYASLSHFLPVIVSDPSPNAVKKTYTTAQPVKCDEEPIPRTYVSQRELNHAMAKAFHGESPTKANEVPGILRERLERSAFQHGALRARKPIVWIPQDVLGISEDEIRQTRDLSNTILISSQGAAMDKKARISYSGNPPGFSHLDSMDL